MLKSELKKKEKENTLLKQAINQRVKQYNSEHKAKTFAQCGEPDDHNIEERKRSIENLRRIQTMG